MWKDIKGWEGLYEVSDGGIVRNKLTKHERCYDINSAGYCRVTLYRKGHNPPRQRYLLHRLVAMTFIPNPDGLPEVNHIDSNPLNNAVSNLEWVDRKENELYSRMYGGKEYKPFSVVFDNGDMKSYDAKQDLADELGVTRVTVRSWLHGICRGYQNRGIKSINYL